MGSRTSYEMGVPAVPLAYLYAAAGEGVNVHLRSTVDRIDPASDEADYYISAVPFERVNALIPDLNLDLQKFTHSPITGIHLWFDRPITELPHAALLDRNDAVDVPPRRALPTVRRQRVAQPDRHEPRADRRAGPPRLAGLLPGSQTRRAGTLHVIKEARATFSVIPGLEADRPGPETIHPKRLSSRRLDRHRLAGHDGRGSQKRVSGRRSGCPHGAEDSQVSGRLSRLELTLAEP